MANPDYDVAYHWTRDKKTGWTTIGHAFVEENGRVKIYLNANPVPGLATYPGELTLYPKRGKGSAQARDAAAEEG